MDCFNHSAMSRMLYELHVRNLALIDEVDVEFGEHLNILTGETGAGKSIIIGSVAMALGGKVSKDIIRAGADHASVELVFGGFDRKKLDALRAMDLNLEEDGLLIIKRKIMPSRSVIKVNDETVTAAKLRQITELIIHMHGQHEHETLLKDGNHLGILDAYLNREIAELKSQTQEYYEEYRHSCKNLERFDMDEASRIREVDFLSYEIDEIEKAQLKENEEEELAGAYKKLSGMKDAAEGLRMVYDVLDRSELSLAVRKISELIRYDEDLKGMLDGLYDAEAIVSDSMREIDGYLDHTEFDEEEFAGIEERLAFVRDLQKKYGGSYEALQKEYEKKKERLLELNDYDNAKQAAWQETECRKEKLLQSCGKLSKARRKGAEGFCKKLIQELKELGFLDVRFELEFKQTEPGRTGFDEVRFLVSLNPGEQLRPLSEVASGGELSRIMLSLKTVMAEEDGIETLIFDEIDAGISGKTAQKVSDKLARIAEHHQVICITHLPQIAAKADSHFEIRKRVREGHTVTEIHVLNWEEQIYELARLLSGEEVTNVVLENAKELKLLATSSKKGYT